MKIKRKNKTERRIFEAADRLTPEPRSFESVTEGVDWSVVAEKCRPSQRRHRVLIPVAIATLALSIAAAIAVPLAIHFSNKTSYYGDGGDSPVLYGTFTASRWVCSDPSFDFSSSTLEVTEGKKDGGSTASLYAEDGNYVCSVHFSTGPFASFEFSALVYAMNEYQGEALYLGKRCPFTVCFPLKELNDKTITVSFGDSSFFALGTVYYTPIS